MTYCWLEALMVTLVMSAALLNPTLPATKGFTLAYHADGSEDIDTGLARVHWRFFQAAIGEV